METHEVGASTSEEPEALVGQAPDGCVVEDAAVRIEDQRVRDLSRCERAQVARLEARQFRFLRKFIKPHERKVEQARRAARGEVLLDAAHSERTSMKMPTATQSPAAMHRRTKTLTACAARAPSTTPSNANTDTQAAVVKSTAPNWRLPAVPDNATMICSTWLVPMAASGTKPSTIIIGTENSAPPAPDSPEPNPASAPTQASSACCAAPRPSR